MIKSIFAFLSTFVMGMAICVQAQNYDDYNLKGYKTPDIKRTSLDFTFNSDGSFVTNSGSYNNTSQLEGLINTKFNRYINTRSFIGEQQIGVELSGSNLKLGGDTSKIKRRQLSFVTSYKNSSRFYITDKWFWNTGGNINFDYNNSKTTNNPAFNELIFNISPVIGLGRGRIEQVQDARQAVYILDELSKKGIITTKLSEEEINSFSQVISAVKNKRFLDSRLHLIDEITNVDSFLVNNNYLKKSGASYFTTLYDYWMYGDLFSRGSGFEVSGQINPSYLYHKTYSKGFRNNQTGITASLLANYEDPINLYWQQSANASIIVNYHHSATKIYEDTNEIDSNANSTIFSGGYSLGYYPNSRTNLNIGISERLAFLDVHSYGINHSSVTSLDLSAYYYISPQLRFSGNINLMYNDNSYNNYNDYYTVGRKWNGNYSMTLTYSLF